MGKVRIALYEGEYDLRSVDMAAVDVAVRDFGTWVIGVGVVVFMCKWLFRNRLRNLKKRFSAWLMNKIMYRVHKYCQKEKRLLFDELEKYHDKQSDQRLHILEVGVGSGLNITHLPPESCLSCIDPNAEHQKYVQQNINTRAPSIKLQKFVAGYAEDMPDFAENTFDAVLCTFVLCSVRNQERALREIRRVLKPGGVFLFLEHVAAPKSSLSRRIQETLQLVWPYLSEGCNLNRETWQQVKKANFSQVHISHFHLGFKLLRFLSSGIFGIARK